MSGCNVVIDKQRSPLFTVEGVTYFWQQVSHPPEARFNQICVGKSVKYNFAFCAVGYAGKKGTFDSILNLKYLIQAGKF